MNEQWLRRKWLKWLLALAFWTLIGLAFASQFYFTQLKRGYPITWRFVLKNYLLDWYVFALLSIPVLWLTRRFRLEGARWKSHVALHLVASALFSVAWVAVRVGIEKLQRLALAGPHFAAFSEMFSWLLVKSFYFNLMVYWVIVSVSHAFEFYRRFRDRELRTVELEKRLTEARLQALQSQLNPHFLFNTLNTISSLMHKDVEAADRMIVRLGELLRSALENVGTQEVPLRQELAFLDSYLEIEQTRFGRRLRIERRIDPETLEALVPNLLLQPLVENAIKHGIEPRARAGTIEIHARRQDGRLCLEVADNGRGLRAAGPPEEGVGLSNTRARLQQLYGAEQELVLANRPDGGLSVRVCIPFRPAAQALAATASAPAPSGLPSG